MKSRCLFITNSSPKLMMIDSHISLYSDFVSVSIINMFLNQIVHIYTMNCSEVYLQYIVKSKCQFLWNHCLDWQLKVGKNKKTGILTIFLRLKTLALGREINWTLQCTEAQLCFWCLPGPLIDLVPCRWQAACPGQVSQGPGAHKQATMPIRPDSVGAG